MIATYLIVWSILIAIGVSDAKAHRIPNKLLLVLLGSLLASCVVGTPDGLVLQLLLDKSFAFIICFLVGLGLHLIRVMAPGDVKLITVLGFWLGTAQLIDYLYYASLMTVFIGLMYWTLSRLEAKKLVNTETAIGSSRYSLAGMAVQMDMGKEQLKQVVSTGQGLTYMPFAPILIMGLALQQYYM